MLLLKQILLKGIVKQCLGLSLAFTWSTTTLFQWGFSTAYQFFIKKSHDKYGITVVLFSLQQMLKWAALTLNLLENGRDSCALFCFADFPSL